MTVANQKQGCLAAFRTEWTLHNREAVRGHLSSSQELVLDTRDFLLKNAAERAGSPVLDEKMMEHASDFLKIARINAEQISNSPDLLEVFMHDEKPHLERAGLLGFLRALLLAPFLVLNAGKLAKDPFSIAKRRSASGLANDPFPEFCAYVEVRLCRLAGVLFRGKTRHHDHEAAFFGENDSQNHLSPSAASRRKLVKAMSRWCATFISK